MSKARTLANLISDNAELADGQISVAEVVGAAPTANPTFTGTVTTDAVTMNGNTTIGDASSDTLTVNATSTFNSQVEVSKAGNVIQTWERSNKTSNTGYGSLNIETNSQLTLAYDSVGGLIIGSSTDPATQAGFQNDLRFVASEIVVNEDGRDKNFRVESDANANAIFMNAENGTTAFGTTTDNYNHASNEGIYLSPGSSSSMSANSPVLRLNRNGTGGNNRSNLELYNNGTLRGFFGSLGAEGGMYFGTGDGAMVNMTLYQDETVVNEDSANHDFRVESNNSANMLFVDAGNDRIGINENTPEHMLHLSGAGDAGIHIQADTNNVGENDNPYLSMSQDGSHAQQFKIGMIGDGGQEFNNSVANSSFIHANNSVSQPLQIAHFGEAVADFYNTSLVFNQPGRDQDFRIESDGNANAFFVNAYNSEIFMGINSQADVAARLHVSVANNIGIEVSDPDTSGFYGIWFARAGVQKGYTQTTASGTTYNTGSDARLKENVSTITDGIDVLNRMRAVEFDWIDEDDAPRTRGFIAQEMVDVAPESVSGDPDGEIMMGMDYGRITPVIVAALQEAITKIETLEARIAALENA